MIQVKHSVVRVLEWAAVSKLGQEANLCLSSVWWVVLLLSLEAVKKGHTLEKLPEWAQQMRMMKVEA